VLRQLISLIIVCALIRPALAAAIVDPLSVPNNPYGIHITDANDLQVAKDLINSQGGSWGYVTLVIREDQRQHQKWQSLFDTMREKKIIPIVRLATRMQPDSWAAPTSDQAGEWADFLDSLNWVIKNRYVILFNEPNHAKEWGNRLAPAEYATVSRAFIEALKHKSPDFFILPAGFDAMAPNSANTMEITRYFQLMHQADSEIFKRFDGWTSHSYPNPHFNASPDAVGKTSLRGYRWEVNYLAKYGLKPDSPVFITETGWDANNLKPSRTQTVSQKLEAYWMAAFTGPFNHRQVVAITPFILRYPQPPFSGFTWLDPDTDDPLPHYRAIQNLPKISGSPAQTHSARTETHTLPEELIADSRYVFSVEFNNTGQSIWTPSEFELTINYPPEFDADIIDRIPFTKPGQSAQVAYAFATPVTPGSYQLTLSLTHQGEPISEIITKTVNVIPPPNVLVKLKVWYRRVSSGNDFTLLIYDQGDVIKEFYPVSVISGQALIENVKSLIPEKEYRFVLVKPYYLPRQTYAVLDRGQTVIEFKRLLPVDFNNDGRWSLADLWAAIKHPVNTIRLIIP
jgi:hypothetical protein